VAGLGHLSQAVRKTVQFAPFERRYRPTKHQQIQEASGAKAGGGACFVAAGEMA